jgi:NAD(P)-dependent dehydrogenase (short-subunit alcohol dehydrogenase family)
MSKKEEETKQMIEAGQKYAFENREAMQRIVQMTHASKEIGGEICRQLADQEVKIERGQDNVDLIDENHDRMAREIRSIESIRGQLLNMITPSRVKARNSGVKAEKEAEKEAEKAAKKQKKKEAKEANKGNKGNKNKKNQKNQRDDLQLPPEIEILGKEAKAQIEETDQMLDLVSNDMSTLKQMALDIGQSLDRQNIALEMMDRTTMKVDYQTRKLDHQTKRMIG